MAAEGAQQVIAEKVASLVREVPDYPEPGVVFRDITPVLADGAVFSAVVEWMAEPFAGKVDVVVAIEARGFIFGAPVAHLLGVGIVPVRKLGKLPGMTVAETYDLEYGQSTLEMHADALGAGTRGLVVDDVIATGGTARATVELIRRAGASVVGVAALLAIGALGGSERLEGFDPRVLFTS